MRRRVIITGAGSGIGFACARHFLAQGDEVLGIDRDTAHLSQLDASERLTSIQLDLIDKASIRASFARFDDKGWVPDILINAAGIREIVPVVDLDDEMFERVLAVNLTAPFILSRECAKRWLARGIEGCIVNIASVSGVMAEPERAAYVSAKHGLIGLTKQLAMEFGAAGIRVNAVSPGVIRTELTEPYFNQPDLVSLIRSNHALGRWGEPDDVVACINYLVSPGAGFVTGANFLVDGGWTAGKRL